MPYLVLPASRYKDSFLTAVGEFQAEGLPAYAALDLHELTLHFDAYIAKLRAEARGEALPPGYVPHTVFWLVEGDEYVGRVDIRHELTDSLKTKGGHIGYDIRPSKRKQGYGTTALKLGLAEAKKLGLSQALVTCDVNNIGSNKIIRANGGKLAVALAQNKNSTTGKNRYWFELGESSED